MLLEAWRWYTLMQEHISFADAHRQVYYSKLAGLITPWRLGEYPARALISNNAQPSTILSMGAVGSATMTAAIIAMVAAFFLHNFLRPIAHVKNL